MLRLESENQSLRLENANLRSELSKLQHELEVLKLNLKIVKDSRDELELHTCAILTENKNLKRELEGREKEETPILPPPPPPPQQPQKVVHFNDIPQNSSPKPVEYRLDKNGVKVPVEDDEDEVHEYSGKTQDADFSSTWKKNLQIFEATKDYIILKNSHHTEEECLDNHVIVRTVNGNSPCDPIVLPFGVVIEPGAQFTIHANHTYARQIFGKSTVMHRFSTFGHGKVTETTLLDGQGDQIAKHVLCHFY